MPTTNNTATTNIIAYVDDSTRTTPMYIYAKQGDKKSRLIRASLKSSSGDVFVTSPAVAQLHILKPNGNYVNIQGTPNNDGTVTFILFSDDEDNEVFSVPGKAICDISVYDENGTAILTTASFYLMIEASVVSMEGESVPEPEPSVLDDIIALQTGKVDKTSVVQTTGSGTTDVMSQKAVTDELALKANTSDVTDALALKADTNNVYSKKYLKVGETPYIYNSDNQTLAIKLVGNSQYIGYTDTVSDAASATIDPRNNYWQKDDGVDYFKYDLVSYGHGWTNSYIKVTFNNLIVGKTYKAVIDVTGIGNNTIRIGKSTTSGDYSIVNSTDTLVATPSFIAASTSQIMYIYLWGTGGGGEGAEGDYIAFNDFYVKVSDSSNEKTEIQNISGVVVGNQVLPALVSGIHLEATTVCDVMIEQPLPDVLQNTGTSTTDVMSQKAVTDELALKANKSEVPIKVFSKMGKTPYTNYDTDIRLSVKIIGTNSQYIGFTDTASDISTATIAPRNNYWEKDNSVEYYKYDLDHTGENWAANYIAITMYNLIVGKSYKIVVAMNENSSKYQSGTNIGKYTLGIHSYPDKTSMSTITSENTIESTSFIADNTSYKFYLTHNKTGATGDCLAFNDIYVKLANSSNKKTEIHNINGTVDGEIIIDNIAPAMHIEASPNCEVMVENVITKPFSNKIIVNFGDSIFGNYDAPNDISTFLSELSGAKVYNIGFGGCRMAKHSSDGYKAFSMYKLADEMVKSDSDETKWAEQENALEVSGIPSYYASHLYSLKSIDFNEVDIITIAYGTNDFMAGVRLDNPENTDDINFFAGALRYSIKKILETYPNLKIFICGQIFRFWTEGGVIIDSDTYEKNDVSVPPIAHKLTDFVSKTKSVAAEYHLPFIDNYANLGINRHNCAQYLSDGTHPNIKGRRLIARHIYHELY